MKMYMIDIKYKLNRQFISTINNMKYKTLVSTASWKKIYGCSKTLKDVTI